MNFGNCAFLVGVEDEGSVGALIAIDIGEGKAGSFGFFGQIPEGLLDVGGDGRGRLLLLQRISLGEKLGGIRALDGQREVARGVGAEGVGRVEEDEFAARAHVPGEGIEALFCSLRFLFAPSIKTVCEQGASFSVDTKHGMAAVGHAFAVGIAGLDAMVFDDEPRHGGFDGAFLVFVFGSFCRARVLFDCILLRCRMGGGCKGQVV